jgi:hypothetical protein
VQRLAHAALLLSGREICVAQKLVIGEECILAFIIPRRASYGTTKYCSYWLRGLVDPNPDCLFLHDVADEADSFSKEDMMAGYACLPAGVSYRPYRTWQLMMKMFFIGCRPECGKFSSFSICVSE